MRNHKSYVQSFEVVDGPTMYRARCSCKWAEQSRHHQWEADDDRREHEDLMLRVQLHLTSIPTLRRWRDLCLAAAEDTNLPTEHRAMWKKQAEELTVRIGDGQPGVEHPQLF